MKGIQLQLKILNHTKASAALNDIGFENPCGHEWTISAATTNSLQLLLKFETRVPDTDNVNHQTTLTLNLYEK